MSAAEILAELPFLQPDEIAEIWQTAGQLVEERGYAASPELLAAIDEADASYAKEGGIPIEDVMRRYGLCPGE